MQDLSTHILDIVENSVSAGADKIGVTIQEDVANDLFLIRISDNGPGMDRETAERVADPFYTTRTTRRVGLGIPFLVQAAWECNGDVTIETEMGKGTTITATFQYSHIDRKPIGDLERTLTVLIASFPDISLTFEYVKQGHSYVLDTGKIALRGIPAHSPEAIRNLKSCVKKWLHNVEHMIR